MSESVLLLLSFLLFMLFFAGVGLASMRVKEDTTDDYLVAGRGMHPALAALSAVSTWNSGYMFIGFIGFVILQGYSAIWIAAVSTIGQLVAWIWLYKYIQKEGEARGIRSLSSLVSSTSGSPEAKLAGVLSVLFLSIYAAAQLTAGGVALETMLNWSPTIGILIGFVLVVAYCYAGGIRASIWTDAAQSCVMIVGSTILCLVALKATGGFSGLNDQLNAIDPAMTYLFPSGLKFGATLWIAAFFLGGLGVAGQPQVVSRVMTLKDDKARKEAMVWFFVWQTPFIILMFLIGLSCRVLLPELGTSGAETGLPLLAMEKLSPFLGGLILASIFAATMSTADSQVLACTAAITDDIRPEWSQDHKTTKQVTLAVAVFATLISLVGQQFPGFGDSVFKLVVLAVYGLGGIFVPLILVRMMGYEPDTFHSSTMMMSAMSAVVVWTLLGYGGSDGIFPSVPGMGAAFAAHFLMCALRDSSISNPFGRYAVPSQNGLIIGGVVVLLLTATVEASYMKLGPSSSSSSGNVVGDYQVNGELSYVLLDSGTEYVADGTPWNETFSTDSVDNADALNIVGLKLTLSYGEDEESQGGVCQSETSADTISGTVSHLEFSLNAAGQNSEQNDGHEVVLEWYNSSMIGTNVSGLTINEIVEQIDSMGAGLGEHTTEISVAAQGDSCIISGSNEDNGEEVTYTIELVVFDYTIEAVTA